MSSTPQLRHDPISGRAVLIAPERATRPGALLADASVLPEFVGECPFCAGHEHLTPPAVATLPAGDPPEWRVRVVPNRYPAVRDELGHHELIVECPQHEASLAELPVDQIAEVLRMVCDRMLIHRASGNWIYGQWFKNHGLAGGASLAHAHSQLIVGKYIPEEITAELPSFLGDGCGMCELISSEIRAKVRVVELTDQWIVLAAFAGRFPYESWIVPREHRAHFIEISDGGLPELADVLRRHLRRLDAVADKPGYNLVMHTAPWTGQDFHWHLELLPRLTGIAGYELGTGIFINPLSPEDAAARLRHH